MARGKKGETLTHDLDGDIIPDDSTSPDLDQDGDATKPPPESKSDRFRRLISKRMATALKKLKAVQQLGHRNQYEYSEVAARAIVEALSTGVVCVQMAYEPKADKQDLWHLPE